MPNIDANNKITDDVFVENPKELGGKINPVPKPETVIGIDTDNEFYKTLVEEGEAKAIDITQLNSFTYLSQNREQLYLVLDTMAEDSTMAAVLETYAEDCTQLNDQGRVMWAESSDSEIQKYITFLLDSLNVDKHLYKWTYSLCKYGDVYLRLFRRSDFTDDLFKDDDKQKTQLNEKFTNLNSPEQELKEELEEKDKETLNENVVIKAYSQDDKLVNYIEMVPNPAEMFELTKFGKSYAYLKTNSIPQAQISQNNNVLSSYYTYKLRRKDVEIYNAVSFVHASLADDTPRAPEKIELFMTDSLDSEDKNAYTVNRGQSILYNSYKIWRENMLLENALLLNRVTKSSILRIIEVEVADMQKDDVRKKLQRVKQLVEQKASINEGNSMQEYVNPGAMENNIYVPTHNGVGAIQTQQIGGDVNVKDIADVDHFADKLFASLKVPKAYFGLVDDAAGFNGGTSLSIISSRYARTVIRIQNAMVQALTDAINILLIDRGLDNYVNKFRLHMQPPVTQEELDKKDAQSLEIRLIDDTMSMLSDIEDPLVKLKILKSLLSNVISNTDALEELQDYIERLEREQEEEQETDLDIDDDFDLDTDFNSGGGSSSFSGFDDDDFDFADLDMDTSEPEPVESEPEETLPSANDLGVDLTDL